MLVWIMWSHLPLQTPCDRTQDIREVMILLANLRTRLQSALHLHMQSGSDLLWIADIYREVCLERYSHCVSTLRAKVSRDEMSLTLFLFFLIVSEESPHLPKIWDIGIALCDAKWHLPHRTKSYLQDRIWSNQRQFFEPWVCSPDPDGDCAPTAIQIRSN
jgi:hypothetical protein